jgi:hypothetical protein
MQSDRRASSNARLSHLRTHIDSEADLISWCDCEVCCCCLLWLALRLRCPRAWDSPRPARENLKDWQAIRASPRPGRSLPEQREPSTPETRASITRWPPGRHRRRQRKRTFCQRRLFSRQHEQHPHLPLQKGRRPATGKACRPRSPTGAYPMPSLTEGDLRARGACLDARA